MIVRQLQVTSAIDAFVAITAFGLLLSINHLPLTGAGRTPTATEWVVISVAIGVVGGTLFHLFLGKETNTDRLFISLAGAIILASGAAAYMRLSPLLPTMIIGAMLINTSGNREEISKVLTKVERPIYFVLLIFAGAAWQPTRREAVLAVVIYLAARLFAKSAAGWVAAAANRSFSSLGPYWGTALWGQGALAVAIGLNYLYQDGSVLANVTFTAAIVSVLLTDLGSARLAEFAVHSARRRLGVVAQENGAVGAGTSGRAD